MILVVLKAAIDRNVNSHCWQKFVSSESFVFSTSIVDGKQSVFQVLGSSKAMRILALKVDRALGALRAAFVNFDSWWEA